VTASILFTLATFHLALAESCHENIYPTDYNSLGDTDRNSRFCSNNGYIASGCIDPEYVPTSSSKRAAEPAGNDETNDGVVEVE
jgi:hypothetical protein